jgi:hypothetical protein
MTSQRAVVGLSARHSMIRYLMGLLALAAATAEVPRYLVVGFTHIIPNGLDHILFVLGLFFLSKDLAILLVQMTWFTLAHSLTLGLSLYGLVALPSGMVEIAIALSIVFIAIENLLSDRLSRWRSGVVIVSGLIHGLGFAHSFAGNAVNSRDFLPALLSFNLGIELGQLAVIGLAYAGVAAWQKTNWYHRAIARPASMAIAAVGVLWAFERAW